MQVLTMKIFSRIHQAKQSMSITAFAFFAFCSPLRRLRRFLATRAISRARSTEERFTLIYEKNTWGSRESVSGIGSTLAFTESIRNLLPELLRRYEIGSIFDAPCGDFNWMRMVDLQGITYVGADIVSPLIKQLQSSYSTPSISFKNLDLTKDTFPKSDLVLNRDCLFHLSYTDILAVLRNFISSSSIYLLSTSHDNESEFENSDIRSGDFRSIDLFASPFNFPRDFLFAIPEPGDGIIPPRKLYLWNRAHVQVAHSNLERYISML
jgi:hypothetical protein